MTVYNYGFYDYQNPFPDPSKERSFRALTRKNMIWYNIWRAFFSLVGVGLFLLSLLKLISLRISRSVPAVAGHQNQQQGWVILLICMLLFCVILWANWGNAVANKRGRLREKFDEKYPDVRFILRPKPVKPPKPVKMKVKPQEKEQSAGGAQPATGTQQGEDEKKAAEEKKPATPPTSPQATPASTITVPPEKKAPPVPKPISEKKAKEVV